MAGFLTNDNIFRISGAYKKHWDTFKRQIIVVKEPTKTIVSSNTTTSPVFGYGEESRPAVTFTYASVTGAFDAQVTSNLDQRAELLPEEVKNMVAIGKIRIKIQQDARDFIEDGRKTENIQYQNQTFNILSFDAVTNFFGLKFFTYTLERSA